MYRFIRKLLFKGSSIFYSICYMKSGGFGFFCHIHNPKSVSIKKGFYFRSHLRLEVFGTGKVAIGKNLNCGSFLHIGCVNRISIGDDVLIGSHVLIIDHDHGSERDYSLAPSLRPLNSKGSIKIGDRVWIGDKVTILANVTIGSGAVIGANTVVTKDVPENTIVVSGSSQRMLVR